MNRSRAAGVPAAADDATNDAPSREGLGLVDATRILKGNADIECEWSPPKPDHAFTLPIYPAPSDLPHKVNR